MIQITYIAGIAIFSGCFARAILPFMKKRYDAAKRGENVKWENRFIWTLIFALFVSIVSTMLILPSFQIPTGYVFPLGFTYGWAAQDIINKVAK